jgi:hypothetical protein
VRVIKEINESINSRKYLVGEILTVKTIKKESEFYHLEVDCDVDMIPKDSVEIVR